MDNLKKTFSYHYVAVIVALILSVLSAFPQAYFRYTESVPQQESIELIPDSPWSGRIREIQDGHNLGSIYYKDGKDDPYLFQPLGSAAVAYMGKIFSLDINDTLLLSRFVLPLLSFLIIYLFIFLFTREKLIALSGASVLLFAESALNFYGWKAIFEGNSPANFLDISNPVNPGMIYILFFGFLVAFWKFYRSPSIRLGIISAILLGLNFYNYFYSWTYLYAFGAFLTVIFLIRKKWKEVMQISSVFVGALFVAIPYAINLYHASQYPTFDDVGFRQGIIFTHAPAFIGLIAFGSIIFYLFLSQKEDREKYFFGLALLLTPFLTLNQQILTGKVMQPAHYHWYFHRTIAVILVLATIFYLFNRYGLHLYKKILAVLIIVISMSIGSFVQMTSYYQDQGDGLYGALKEQKYSPVMSWLNENAEKESVVLGTDVPSLLTTIYTPLNVFYHRGGMLTLPATKERLMEVMFTFYRLKGVTGEVAREAFFKDRGNISLNLYAIHYRDLIGSYEDIPDQEIEDFTKAYKDTLSISTTEWLKKMFIKYEVEYIIWDKIEDPSWELDKYSFLKKEVDFEGVSIYTFNP